MAVDKPISELNPAGELSGSEPVAIVQGGETVRTTTEEIANKGTAFMVSNEVYTLEVQNDDLSGTGSIESQLVAYILALPTLQRTILKTQSKWNVRLLNGAQLLSVHEIVGKGIGVISTLGVANLQLIYEAGASGVNEFTELLDAPNSYTGQAGKVVKVNSTEDGLEFADEAGGGAVDSVNGQTGVVVLDATDVDALQRDGSNANSDVDLGAFNLNAKGVKINGTAGAGHLGMKHQSTNATAGGQETVIFAGNDGEPRYKNDGGAIEQFASRAWVLAQGFITNVITALGYTPANRAGDTFTGNITATNLSGTNTGDETATTIRSKVGNASASNTGVLSSTDWTSFNNRIVQNDWVDISLTSTISGFSTITTRTIEYLITGDECTLLANIQGTSNSAVLTFTIPFNYTGLSNFIDLSARIVSNGTPQNFGGMVRIIPNTNLVEVFLNGNATGFATTGNKQAQLVIKFKIN